VARKISLTPGIDWPACLRPHTAHQYVKRVRAVCDTVSRTQLVVYGLRDAWIVSRMQFPRLGERAQWRVLFLSGCGLDAGQSIVASSNLEEPLKAGGFGPARS